MREDGSSLTISADLDETSRDAVGHERIECEDDIYLEGDVPVIDAPTAAAVLGLGSRAEVMLRQLTVTAQVLRAANGTKGEMFKLTRRGRTHDTSV